MKAVRRLIAAVYLHLSFQRYWMMVKQGAVSKVNVGVTNSATAQIIR